MRTGVSILAIGILVGACATPQPTDRSSSFDTAVARASASLLLPSATSTLTVRVGDWSVSCEGVPADDCEGVGALFIKNLARNWKSVFDESGGKVSVEPRPICPAVPDWADPEFCWEATALTLSRPICMVVARQAVSRPAGFGQIGGDEMAGRFQRPQDWPTCT